MAKTVECRVAKIEPDGSIEITFTDGHGYIFTNLDELRDYVKDIETEENARRILLGKLLAIEPNLGSLTWIRGKACTIDITGSDQIYIR